MLDIIHHIQRERDIKRETEGDESSEKRDGSILSQEVIATVLKQVLQGLEFLHSNAHVHR